MLATPSRNLNKFLHPVALPLDPTVIVTGIVPGTKLSSVSEARSVCADVEARSRCGLRVETAYMFKSAKLPLLLTFRTTVQRDYTVRCPFC